MGFNIREEKCPVSDFKHFYSLKVEQEFYLLDLLQFLSK